MSPATTLVTTQDVARRYQIHGDTVRNAIHDGRLPAIQLGGRYFVDSDDAEKVFGECPDRRHTANPRPARKASANHG